MTFAEFSKPYAELADAFGQQNFNPKRGTLLFKYVSDLPTYWWKGLVERMIIENNPKLNIAEAANSERKAANSAKRAQEESEAAENLLRNASDASLKNMKQQYESGSILDLMEKMKWKRT